MTRIIHLILATLLAIPSWSHALSSDRDQPMMIEADRVELDDTKGVSIYTGNVKVTQGTLVLTGDRMVVHNKGNDIDKVLMDGNPATYKQRPDGKEHDVHAQSRRMEYYTNPEHIILLQQAEVNQAGDVLRSERIVYDVVKDQVNAGTDKPDDRVIITIQPKPKKENKATPAP
ncbi:lipopolysaccharide export system protein LptA [Thiogranum longum]|uniref:Lipopolysaccharide export system protein LptA n=1 Tax=Thiogranum longum TaxID=1537524 RepID=A0A4R1H8I6_9GAMM|nr:lipopolysaccharide transport periplasmic protein LptA [Thiogranum longum]TCK17558.1 lipopolysaccharide export system protein LptA [Thiogranum longum]